MNTVLTKSKNDCLKEIAIRYQVPDYYIWSFRYFLDQFDFRDKRVLEIGGSSLPEEFIEELDVDQWICVDILGHNAGSYQSQDSKIPIVKMADVTELTKNKNLIIDGNMCDFPESICDYFDVIVTVNCMEHVTNMNRFLRVSNSVLKQDGKFLSSFGPLWSCAFGSHFWGSPDWDFNKPGVIEEWDHLLLRPAQMLRKIVDSGIELKDAERVVEQIYHSPRINRLFYSDYIDYLEQSPFTNFDVKTHYNFEPSAEKLAKLRDKYENEENFAAYSLIVSAVK